MDEEANQVSDAAVPLQQPLWNQALRALREARGITQDGWAAWLGYSRSTVQRWERGEVTPDVRAEEAIVRLCQEQGLFRTYGTGPLAGLALSPETLRTLLAEARLGAGHGRGDVFAAGSILTASWLTAPPSGASGRDSGLSEPGGVPGPASTVPLLVGRRHEVELLTGYLEEAISGHARVVLVQGDAGVGKTRLIKELQARAMGQGAQVSYGRAYEDLTLPYLPFAESLLAHLGHAASVSGGSFAADVQVINAFLHGAGAAPAAERVLPADADHDRLRVFLAVSRATVRLAQLRPLLLVVDDLHWADQASLDLFGHLVFAVADAAERERVPLMVVGAHRPVEPDQRLFRTLTRVHREAICRTVALSGLNEAETEELIRGLGLTRSSHQLLETIMRATHGNPLFVQEVLEHLARTGALVEQGGYLTSSVSAADLPMPVEVREAIRARIDGLSADCRELLTVAAFLGDSFSLQTAGAVSGRDEDALLPLLEAGIEGRFLVSEGEAFRFAHPLIRRAFYGLPIGARRRRMHRHVAETLERLYASDADAHVLEIAHHLVEAGEAAPVAARVHYARRAGERALAQFAWSEAARFYDAAVQAAESDASMTAKDLADLHFWAGFALYRDLDPGPSLSSYEKAIEEYRELGDLRGLALALMGHRRIQLSHGLISIGAKAEVEPLEDVLNSLGHSAPELRGEILAEMGEVYFMGRQEEQALEASRQALAIGQRIGNNHICNVAGFSLGLAQWQSLHLADALETFEQALVSARRTDDLWLQGWPLFRIPLVLIGLGRLDETETAALEACDVGRTTQDWAEDSLALCALESIAVVRGEFDTAERHARDAMQMAYRARYSWGGTIALTTIASGRLLRGAWAEAEDALNIWIEPGRVFDEPGPFIEAGAWAYRQLIRAYAGEVARVRAEIGANPRLVAGRGRPDLFSLARLCALVEIAAEVGDPAMAERPHEALRLAHDRGVILTSGWVYFIPRVLGVAAALNCWWDEAERHFQEAMATATRIGARPEVGRSCLDYARMLARRAGRADRRHAVELLRQAIPTFHGLGMEPFVQRAVALAETLDAGIALPQASAPRHPDGLTDHEVRILLEFARGRAEEQIADDLLISSQTVTRYAGNIQAKTGIGRNGATAYAAVKGLPLPGRLEGGAGGVPLTGDVPRPRVQVQPLIVILFSDIKDSTGMAERLGDRRWVDMLRAHNAIVHQHVAAHGGSEIKHTGDGVFASFPSASGALACAVAIQQALAEYARAEGVPALGVRIGLNAGEPVPEEGDLFGVAVNLAQRICARAAPGTILVSETVRELARGKGFTFASRGRAALKGFTERFRLYEVAANAAGE